MNKAQSMTEYAIFIAAVVLGILVMKGYVAKGYLGYTKKSADSLGAGQFSYKYSNYTQVRETRAFDTDAGFVHTSVTKGSSNADSGVALKSVTTNNQITRTINADISVNKDLPAKSFDSAKSLLADAGSSDFDSNLTSTVNNPDALPTGYSVTKTGNVIDDFSNKNLTDDNKTFDQ